MKLIAYLKMFELYFEEIHLLPKNVLHSATKKDRWQAWNCKDLQLSDSKEIKSQVLMKLQRIFICRILIKEIKTFPSYRKVEKARTLHGS